MKPLIIVLFYTFFISDAISQVDNSRATAVNTNRALTDIVNEIRSLDNGKVDDVIGSPFMYDAWLLGTLTTTFDNTFYDILLKYDQFNRQLIYKKAKSDDSLFVNMDMVKEFSLFRDSIRFVRHDILSLPADVKYYQILYIGENLNLVKEMKKEILQFDSDSSSPTKNQRRFITRDRVLLLMNDSVCEVKKRRKKALECFAEKEKELKSFVKDNRLDFGKEDELIRIVKKFEQIK